MTAITPVRNTVQNEAQKASVLAHLTLLDAKLAKLELATSAKAARGELTDANRAALGAHAAELKTFLRDLERGINRLLLDHGRQPRYTPSLWR